MDVLDLFAKIILDISGYERGLEDAKSDFTGASSEITAKTIAIGTAIGNMATKAAGVVFDFGKSSLSAGMEFDAAMSQVAAISGATGGDFDALRLKAQEMGASTKFSATESAEALNYMAMAGWDTNQMLGGLEGIMNLAAASGENLATTSDIVTDALTAFGMTAEESGHFADVLAAASSGANTNVSMLGESFKYVAPVAGAMKYSAEDTAIALGVMANSGIKASQAGTALRTLLTNMAKPTDAMSIAMDTLGVSLTDNEGNMRSLLDVLGDLREGFTNGSLAEREISLRMGEFDVALSEGSITEEEYAEALSLITEEAYNSQDALMSEYAAMLAGKEGMSGLLAIVNASDKDFKTLTDSIYESSSAYDGLGTAAHQASVMQDNLSGDITIFKSALEGAQIELSDRFSPAMRNIVKLSTEFVSEGGIGGVIDTLTALSPVIAGGTAAFVAFKTAMAISSTVDLVTKAIKAAQAADEGLTIAQAALNAVMNANPFVLIATLIAAVGTALVTLYLTNEDFRNKVNEIWWNIHGAISDVVSKVVVLITETIPEALRTSIEFFKSIPDMAKQWGIDMIENFINGIKSKISGVKNAVTGVAQIVKDNIGFSEPKEGPLSNFHTYAPDMMKLFSDGIEKNSWRVKDSFDRSLNFGTATLDYQSSGVGRATAQASAQLFQSIAAQDATFNLVVKMNDAILAREMYRANLREGTLQGGSFVGGTA